MYSEGNLCFADVCVREADRYVRDQHIESFTFYSMAHKSSDIERMGWTTKQYHIQEKDGLTEEELASTRLSTIEWSSSEQSFYAILNRTLNTAHRQLLKP